MELLAAIVIVHIITTLGGVRGANIAKRELPWWMLPVNVLALALKLWLVPKYTWAYVIWVIDAAFGVIGSVLILAHREESEGDEIIREARERKLGKGVTYDHVK